MDGTDTSLNMVQPIWTASLETLLDKIKPELLNGAGGKPLTITDLWPYGDGGGYAKVMQQAIEQVEASFAVDGKAPRLVPTSSGTSAIQVALGGLQIPAGSEVIVTPITDPGSVNPILFHNAIPVFADVDRDSGLITPDTVADVLTSRTSAIIAVHLTGSAVDVPGIRKMLDAKGRSDVKIIEDVAQGLGARLNGVPLGMLGDAGCFSLNAQKHVSVGEGGFVLTRSDDDFYRCHNFSDKHRDRFGGGAHNPEHETYAGAGHSLRLSTLQGAMLLAQWRDLPGIALARRQFGSTLGERLQATSDLVPQAHLAGAEPSYFGFMFKTQDIVEPDVKNHLTDAVGKKLGMKKRPMGNSYTDKDRPIYKYPLFENRNFPGKCGDVWAAELLAAYRDPAGGVKRYDYTTVCCPNAEAYIKRAFWVFVRQDGTPENAIKLADAIVKVFVDANVAKQRP